MNIHSTTVPGHFTDILKLNPPKINETRYAHRVRFAAVGEKGAGLYAEVPAPNEGMLHSLAVMPIAIPPSGDLIVSTINPTFHYDAFFLYAILDEIPITTKGTKVWRKTEIHGAAYSTIQANLGKLYLMILNGPTGEFLADIAITAKTA